MAYEMVMPYHLHMPSYFLETFTEYPYFINIIYGTKTSLLKFCPVLKVPVLYIILNSDKS